MRAYTTLTQTILRRMATGFAVVALLTSMSMTDSIPLRADDGLGGPMPVDLVYFGAIPMGFDEWFVDGAVDAPEMSSVTVTLGGAASGIGTISPDSYGYFSFDLVAAPYDDVSADATDGITSDSETITLYSWF